MFLSNQLIARGNLGNDPEIRYSEDGKQIVAFRLAISNRKKDRTSGEWVDDTWWVRVSVFGQEAERASKLHKGSKVVVFGRCGTPSIFQGQNGPMVTTEIVANDILYLDPRPQTAIDDAGLPWEAQAPQTPRQPVAGGVRSSAPTSRSDMDDLDSVPF